MAASNPFPDEDLCLWSLDPAQYRVSRDSWTDNALDLVGPSHGSRFRPCSAGPPAAHGRSDRAKSTLSRFNATDSIGEPGPLVRRKRTRRRVYRVALAVQPGRLEEVQGEGKRGIAQRQAGRETIQAAELDRIPTPGPTGDLASYLQTLPGVVSVGNGGEQLFI